MDWTDYCKHTGATAIYPGAGTYEGIPYCLAGFTGEGGEVFDHLKKVLRDDNGVVTDERRAALKKEIGDICYYISELARCVDVVDAAHMPVAGGPSGCEAAFGFGRTVLLGLLNGWAGVLDGLTYSGASHHHRLHSGQRSGASENIAQLLCRALDVVGALCVYAGVDFAEVLQVNHDKLASRRERGVLSGSGDDR